VRNLLLILAAGASLAVGIGCNGNESVDTGGTGGAVGGTSGAGALSGGRAAGGSSNTGGGNASGGVAGCGGCNVGLTCCAGTCVNQTNDLNNCGSCGRQCAGPTPYCHSGTCTAPPCGLASCAGLVCCGNACCAAGQICCDLSGPVAAIAACTTPVNGTCPVGCTNCVCASPDTLIATPEGNRPIAALRPGDFVYSAEPGGLVAVPLARVIRRPVSHHSVVHIETRKGAVLDISAPHPTADGRTFGDLRVGDFLDGDLIVTREIVPYAFAYTYDILPASSSGTYLASGLLIGSTLE
jgi:hypothetical protein